MGQLFFVSMALHGRFCRTAKTTRQTEFTAHTSTMDMDGVNVTVFSQKLFKTFQENHTNTNCGGTHPSHTEVETAMERRIYHERMDR